MTERTFSEIPAEMRALVLRGKGFENLRIERVPVPRPGPRQLLARVDAAGICTSLIKLIEQGPDHRLLYGWDTRRHPLVLGDEGSVTLVQVGRELHDRFEVGQRYVVQPAVDHAPVNHIERYRNEARGIEKVAVGYTLPGHLAEFILIPEEVILADCLLPVPDTSLPFSHASMSEPYSCVLSAQDHHVHLVQDGPLSIRKAVKGLRQGGLTLIVGAGAMGRMHIDLALSSGPRAIIVSDLLESRLELTRRLFGTRAQEHSIGLHLIAGGGRALSDTLDSLSDYSGADDVIVAVGSGRAIEESQHLVARGGNLNLFGGLKKGQDLIDLDTALVHYREMIVTGSSGGSPGDVARTLEFMASGAIDASVHITRVGDLEHSADFLQMIQRQELDGKAIVYPHRRLEKVRPVSRWNAEDEQSFLAERRST